MPNMRCLIYTVLIFPVLKRVVNLKREQSQCHDKCFMFIENVNNLSRLVFMVIINISANLMFTNRINAVIIKSI